jgi:hypothetical protein
MNFNYSNAGILSTELPGETIPGEPNDGDFSGSTFRVDDSRERFQFSLGWGKSLSERQSMNISGNASKVDYDLVNTGRFDYDTYGFNLGYKYQLAQKQSMGISALAKNFSSGGLGPCFPFFPSCVRENDSDSIGLNLNYTYDWSQTTSLTFAVGRNQTDSTRRIANSAPIDSKVKNTLMKASLVHRGELTDYSLFINRVIVPSSTGSLNTVNSLQLGIRHEISELITLQAGLRFSDSESVLNNETLRSASSRQHLRLDLKSIWKLTRNFLIISRYIYRYGDQGGDIGVNLGSADGHAVNLGFTYKWRI